MKNDHVLVSLHKERLLIILAASVLQTLPEGTLITTTDPLLKTSYVSSKEGVKHYSAATQLPPSCRAWMIPTKDHQRQYASCRHSISLFTTSASDPLIVPPARCWIGALDPLAHSGLFSSEPDDGQKLPRAFVTVANEFATGKRARAQVGG